jgi:hypothetical protein
MANILSKSGITTGNTVETWHVTQSIDAFLGEEAYDIILSGSLNVVGPTIVEGSLTVTGSIFGTPGILNILSASFSQFSQQSFQSISSSYSRTSSFSETSISSSYAVTASYALNGEGGSGSSFPYTGSAIISGSLIVTGSVAFNEGNFYSPNTSVDNSIAVNTAIENVAYAGGTLLVDLGQDGTNKVRLSLDTIPTIPTKYTILFTNPTPGAGADFRLQQSAGEMYGNVFGNAGGQFISASSLIQSNAGKPFPDTKIELVSYNSGWNVQIYTATGSDFTV